jgi:predicted O-methyltransferase YrrM
MNVPVVMSVSSRARRVFGRREPLLDAILRDSLLGHGLRPMQVDDNAARILQLLVLLHRPRLVVEVGTFFGYSAIHIARGLPDGGRLISLEAGPQMAELAGLNIARAGLAASVLVVACDAVEYLRSLKPQSVDMVFIDADKEDYPEYLRLCYPALARGGLLVADDALALGDYSAETGGDSAAAGIAKYNLAVARSPNLFSAFVGTDNGLLISYKK